MDEDPPVAHTPRRAVGLAASALAVVLSQACVEPAPTAPPEPSSEASRVEARAASAVPSWTPRRRSGRTDPTIRDEWNPGREGPVPPGGACRQRGCDTSRVELRGPLAPADAALGTHTFTVVADGRSTTCDVEVTSTAARALEHCPFALIASVGPTMKVVETREGDVVAAREEPVPGMFKWSVRLGGEPARVRVVHRFEGRTVLDAAPELRYAPDYPNGPACPPACRKAVAEIAPSVSSSPSATPSPR
jgi:hypothetical protein